MEGSLSVNIWEARITVRYSSPAKGRDLTKPQLKYFLRAPINKQLCFAI